ncbi:unnamed protein product [Paramecium sonneborni]|uniref:Transmembrane protein n=1 Tax=Paramecium sonneborni TaxID=65129 RepID=A0A8S1Q027_9CILI|nr:unnamed protein product [Paramecium sonneborni]
MKITSSFYLIFLAVELSICWIINNLSTYHPLAVIEIINDEQFEILQNGFGIWSKYQPLSNFEQIGEIGQLDSYCFHLFRIEDRITNELHFVYYECITFETKTIKKYFQFLSHDGSNFKEEILINDSIYESTWYFGGILQISSENLIFIPIYKEKNQIFLKLITSGFLSNENNYNLIIGGDFQVNRDSQLYTFENRFLSSFPGQIIYIEDGYFFQTDYYFEMIEQLQINACSCKSNLISLINDLKIEKQDQYEFISEKPNCQQFILSVWIKIHEIHLIENEFYYQLMRLSGNFQDPQMVDANLCAFQLFYKISQLENQIIITTYSYTFPSINIDFSNNPFLKTQTLNIDWDIQQLWHYILVEKKESSIQMQVIFYKGVNQKEFNLSFEVMQFNNVQFKLLIGNIFQSEKNFLEVQVVGIEFINCPDDNKQKIGCHPTCKECDGPTKNDCLSCFESKNRKYLEDFKECVCWYGTIDQDYQCNNYQALQYTLMKEELINEQCKYGFFEYDANCYQCPSIINANFITCLECIQDPKKWAQKLICQTTLIIDKNGNAVQYLQNVQQKYYLIGNDLLYCPHCDLIGPFQSEIESIQEFNSYCKSSQSIHDVCYFCGYDCGEFKASPIHSSTMIKTDFQTQAPWFYNQKICDPPNFIDFTEKCVDCKIKNCLYCFNYLESDPTKTTLGFQEQYSLIDEEIKVGCAQCIEGFIYEFQTGKCINQRPSQENCLRSYINLKNQEICTLSAIDDFNIAFEIINCQSYILYCQQCIKTIYSTLKCLICEDNFYTSSKTGVCQKCNLPYTKKCFFDNYLDPWKWQVQGFTIQFLPNRPIFTKSVIRPHVIATECIEGYQILFESCQKYCDQDCVVCKSFQNQRFDCSKCSLNYYKERIISVDNGKCIQCPQLCQICQNRSIQEIKELNPYFIITPENLIYTQKCIQKIPLELVHLDSNQLVAQYCFENNCNYYLEYQYNLTDCNHLDDINFYLKNYFQYLYPNEIGLQKIKLIVQVTEYCLFYYTKIYIENYFKELIFSIKQSSLKFQNFNYPLIMRLPFWLQISKFDSIILSQLQFSISSELTLIFGNNNSSIDLKILDTVFYSSLNTPAQIQIQADKLLNLHLQNISILNINIENSLIFNINFSDYGQDFIITNFLLRNCILTNSTLFNFQNSLKSITIENIIIDSCKFYNSAFANFNQKEFSKTLFNEVSIINSLFQNSNFICSFEKMSLNISNISIQKNQILNTNFIIFNSNLYCNNIFLKDNNLIWFKFISQSQSLTQDQEILINNIQISGNTVNHFFIYITEQKQTLSQRIIQLINFYFEENIISCSQEQYLLIINCFNLTMQNIFLRNTTNFEFISIFATPFINIINIIYENQIQKLKVRIQPDCFENCIPHSSLLFISGFANITLNQIQIINSFSIDKSIISIQSNPLILLTKQKEYIKIKDMLINGNILIKLNQGTIISLIEVTSTKFQIIEIENLNFFENVFHQYYEDLSETFASLLYVDSGPSFIVIKNINCSNNSITNSSSGYISIFSNEIQIENFQAIYHNYIDQKFWIQYYEIQIMGNFNQKEISYIISKIYQFENIRGSLQILANKFTLYYGSFSYIQAKGSSIFNINLLRQGIVIISNCSITHVYNSYISNFQNDGVITINAKKSQFTLYLQNLTLKDVINKLSSSILTIYPSPSQNIIHLKNIFVKNCFSLINQILNFEFDLKNAQKNIVKIENFRIFQLENALQIFLQSVGKLNQIDLQKMINNNAIMNFLGCSLTLNEIQMDGIIMSSVLKITDSEKLSIRNLLFINILTFYPLHLIEMQQSNIVQSKMYLNNIKIQNLNDFQFTNYDYYYFNYNHIDVNLDQCSLISNYLDEQIQKNELVQTFFEEIRSNSNQNGSLIKVKSLTNQTIVSFNKIFILNNNCQYCYEGLLFFDISAFKKIQISELFCIKNFINNYGCILAKSNRKIESKIQIDYSSFISNNGRQGSGLFIQNLKVKLSNSKIINNTASSIGGGFYFEEGSERFTIQSSIICNNKAALAGGIYLNGNSSLSQNNFIQSFLLFNEAQLSSDNLNELPTRLILQINLQEMFSQEHQIEQNPYQILKLRPFYIISQGSVIQSNFLLIPSGQQIQNYQLYNSKLQKYQSYLDEFTIMLKNSMNEKLITFDNSTCKIYQQIFDIQSSKVIELTQISIIHFNQDTKSFNLSSLEFNLDPYLQDNKIYEILIYCNTQYQQESLAYRIRVNSFLCQLGEFYIFSGCQRCKSEQGFYSVTYNTTKCSIFDKNKFEAITSNRIQLKPGFWRPNQISDFVEYCYKNPINCLGGWNVGNDLCSIGHLGGYCEECDRFNIRGDGKFFKNQQQVDCQQCQELSSRLLTFFLLSIWAVVSTLLTIKSIEKSNQLFTQLKIRQNFTEILFKLNQDHESILLKLFLNYLWVFSLIFTFNINFSFQLNFIKQSNDTSYFMANYFECFLAEISVMELMYSRILVMLGLMISQIVIIFIGFQIISLFKKSKFHSRIITIACLYLYIQNYASLINQFFLILAVRKISNLSYISGDVSLIYGSQNHITWIYAFAIPGSILVGLILPVSLFLILYINQDKHNKISFRRHIGYLFNEYTKKNYFWEMIKLWKKTIIIIILIYFESDIFLKASILGLCLLVYQLTAQYYKPYILTKFNIYDIQSGQLCSIALFLAVVKYTCKQQGQSNLEIIIQTIIILNGVILSYPFIVNILRVYYSKYRLPILSLLLYAFQILRPNFIFTKFLKKKLDFLRQKEDKVKTNIKNLKKVLFQRNLENLSVKNSCLQRAKSQANSLKITIASNLLKDNQ